MEIKFKPFVKEDIELLKPIPAIKNLPEWYKQKKPHINEQKIDKFNTDGTHNLSIKRCNPVTDAFATGYFIVLENAINVEKNPDDENSPLLNWTRGGEDFISMHHQSQIDKKLVPAGFATTAFKFRNFWSAITPKNYSLLFTHPLNRGDLPFYTMSGIVDTDDYQAAVQFPFFIRKDFEGIIEAGTPVAQLIPIKRESWTSFLSPFSKDFYVKNNEIHNRQVTRFYKKFFWKRKEYS